MPYPGGQPLVNGRPLQLTLFVVGYGTLFPLTPQPQTFPLGVGSRHTSDWQDVRMAKACGTLSKLSVLRPHN